MNKVLLFLLIAGPSLAYAAGDPVYKLEQRVASAMPLSREEFEEMREWVAQADTHRLGYVLYRTAENAAEGAQAGPEETHNYEMDLLRLLLQKGVDVNYRTPSGRTALENVRSHHAPYAHQVMHILIAAGAHQ